MLPSAHSLQSTAAAQTDQRSRGHQTPSTSPGRAQMAGAALREAGGTRGCRWWAAASWLKWKPSRRGEHTRWGRDDFYSVTSVQHSEKETANRKDTRVITGKRAKCRCWHSVWLTSQEIYSIDQMLEWGKNMLLLSENINTHNSLKEACKASASHEVMHLQPFPIFCVLNNAYFIMVKYWH